jgi:hypothetical protein
MNKFGPWTHEAIVKSIANTLKPFGIGVSPGGPKMPIATLDAELTRNKVSLENRLMIKSMLRQIDAIE